MKRYDVINELIDEYGYVSYLEIGTQSAENLKQVQCDFKVGIDPEPAIDDTARYCDRFYRMTSNGYFSTYKRKHLFDIVFIDGLHHYPQVIMDFQHVLNCLLEGCCVVVHDCNPQSEEAQEFPYKHTSTWNGNVWRAWLRLRYDYNMKMFVVDTDQGCGVIFPYIVGGKPLRHEYTLRQIETMSYQEFANNREKLLNLISVDEFSEYIQV